MSEFWPGAVAAASAPLPPCHLAGCHIAIDKMLASLWGKGFGVAQIAVEVFQTHAGFLKDLGVLSPNQ